MTQKELVDKYSACSLCTKCQTGKKVFGYGNLSAEVVVIGDGPGKNEVDEGKPFVGEAGKLLDTLLAGINLKRDDLYFTNTISCRTDDKNRQPTKDEYLNCRMRLYDELSIVKPRFTLLVGGAALKTIVGEDYKVTESHGEWFTLLGEPCYLYFSTFHPSWVLHAVNDGESKAKKIELWKDLKKFAQEMAIIKKSFYKI